MSDNIRRSLLGALTFGLAAWAVAGCEGDFIADPARPRVVRNLGTPYGVSDSSSEVMRADSGAFSILTVDIPNNRNEPAVAHWAEPLPSYYGNQGAAPQPTVIPQTQPVKVPPPSHEIKIVGPQKPDGFFSISRDNANNADLWVTNPSGVGTVTLEREGDIWPAIIRVHFRYDQGRPFSHLERFAAAEALPAAVAAEAPKPVTSAPAGSTGPEIVGGGTIPLKATYNKNSDVAQIAVPGFSRAQRIQISWGDTNLIGSD
jgi:hypothetical protein